MHLEDFYSSAIMARIQTKDGVNCAWYFDITVKADPEGFHEFYRDFKQYDVSDYTPFFRPNPDLIPKAGPIVVDIANFAAKYCSTKTIEELKENHNKNKSALKEYIEKLIKSKNAKYEIYEIFGNLVNTDGNIIYNRHYKPLFANK